MLQKHDIAPTTANVMVLSFAQQWQTQDFSWVHSCCHASLAYIDEILAKRSHQYLPGRLLPTSISFFGFDSIRFQQPRYRPSNAWTEAQELQHGIVVVLCDISIIVASGSM